MNDLTMGQRIAEERKKLGLSQEALGERTGVSRQAISKWESDGAVPEIDKLIALSRLFGVSVGWLLGVEEKNGKTAEELNETQLKMVEEIVRRHQPEQSFEDNQMKKFRLGAVCLVFLAAALALTVLGLRRPDTETRNLMDQVASLRQENVRIQSQLDEITQRLENMGQDVILTDCKMELLEVSPALEPGYDLAADSPAAQTDFQPTFAKLSLNAIPLTRQEGDEALLTVFLKGREITTVPLGWYENAYRAEFVLPVTDGYEYCFVLVRDGVRQMQYLKNTGCDLLDGMTAPTFTMFEPGSIRYTNGKLLIEDLTYSFYLKNFGMEEGWTWDRVDMVLTVNDQEVYRIKDGFSPEDGYISPGGLKSIMLASFPAPDLQEGDDIRLYIDAELSSGVTAKVWLLSMALVDGKIEYGIIAN